MFVFYCFSWMVLLVHVFPFQHWNFWYHQCMFRFFGCHLQMLCWYSFLLLLHCDTVWTHKQIVSIYSLSPYCIYTLILRLSIQKISCSHEGIFKLHNQHHYRNLAVFLNMQFTSFQILTFHLQQTNNSLYNNKISITEIFE